MTGSVKVSSETTTDLFKGSFRQGLGLHVAALSYAAGIAPTTTIRKWL
jgi:hypothetical protein